jgi:hypothetical protein
MINKTTSSLTTAAFLLLLVVFSSCAASKRFREDVNASRDKERGNFIETFDGEVIEGDNLNVRYPFFKKPFVEINKQEVVKLKDVKVLQNNAGYYRNVNGQLAPRVKKGLLNMYMTTETYQEYQAPSGANTTGRWKTRVRYVYWIQKGAEGGITRFTPDALRGMISDYEPAMEYMNEYDRQMKKVRTWSWINTGAVIGGLVLAGAAGTDENNNVTAAGYAGAGLFAGGLIYGIVNKVRRVKAYKNVELAFDEYNRQGLRNRKR